MNVSPAKDNLSSSHLQKHKQKLRASSSSAAMTALMLAVFGAAAVAGMIGLAPIAKAEDLRGNSALLPTDTTYYSGFGNRWGGNDGNVLGTAAAAAPTNGVGGKGADATDPLSPHKGKGGVGGAVGGVSIDPSISTIVGGAGAAGQNVSSTDTGSGGNISGGGGGGGGAGLYLSNNSYQYTTISG